MKKQKPKVEIDYTPYHVRQQAWYMSLLKFYKTIEFNDKIYTDFATKLLSGKMEKEILQQLDSLRRKHKKIEQKKWEDIKRKGATRVGLSFRSIYRSK
jgi:hypothetical protein